MVTVVKACFAYCLVLSVLRRTGQAFTFVTIGTRLSQHQLHSRSIPLRNYDIKRSRYMAKRYQPKSRQTLSVTNNDDEKEQETSESVGTRTRVAVDQFMTGAQTVHKNFLRLYWKNTVFLYKWLTLLQFSIVLAYLVYPKLGLMLLRARTSVLVMIDSFFLNLVGFIMALPVFLVLLPALMVVGLSRFLGESFGGPVQSLLKNNVSKPIARSVRWITSIIVERERKAGPRKSLGEFVKSSNRLFALFLVLVIGPVVEELVYRRGVLVGLKSLWFNNKQHNENKDEAPSKSVPTVLGHSPWVLASSVVFAASHISNWAGPLRDVHPSLSLTDIQTRESMRLSVNPLFQSVTTLWTSLYLFSPMFEKHGLVASIGSHVTWNLNTFFLPWALAIRGVNRLRLSINKRILKRDSSKDGGEESVH